MMGKLERKPWPVLVATLCAAAGMGCWYLALATATDMEQLPVHGRFGCQNCHVLEHPTGADHTLNSFGADFLANGRTWNAQLAALDSDGDGCLNGVELGDSDGDGVPDENVHEETGNPGVSDECGGGALVDEVTWGTLKSLFDSN